MEASQLHVGNQYIFNGISFQALLEGKLVKVLEHTAIFQVDSCEQKDQELLNEKNNLVLARLKDIQA
ncbi:hypothetical protein [Enterococcus nangangensis]|uniref:hypothetical protein n=1 Tax=Enterococcus nangangensis TaxID=2559926 RepID=UPI0010F828FE|nr:hypothetical protein [Enterococcus nangangensis]